MDMQMPVMDGRDAMQWLRRHGWKGPIVAVSVYDAPEDHEWFMKLGCNDCIVKPLTEASLQPVLEYYLKRECPTQPV